MAFLTGNERSFAVLWKGGWGQAVASCSLPRGPYLLVACLLAILTACDIVPPHPQDVFMLYRERMQSGKLQTARMLLSEESRTLISQISSAHKLDRPPENLALLNILDPAAVPVVSKKSSTEALLKIRTLKGGHRLIRLTKDSDEDPWHIDLTSELNSLRDFLRARAALDELREQAGEYAASYRAFREQLERLGRGHEDRRP